MIKEPDLIIMSASGDDYRFSKDFVSVLTELHETGDYSDVTVVLEDGASFKAHKLPLALQSGFFNGLFQFGGGLTEEQVKLKEVPSEAFAAIMEWIYKQKLPEHRGAEDVVRVADYLLCDEVVDVVGKTTRHLTLKIDTTKRGELKFDEKKRKCRRSRGGGGASNYCYLN